MNKRFMLKNKLWLTILSIATSIILLVVSVVNILQLCEVGQFRSYNHTLHICSTIVSLLIIIFLLGTVFGSAYTFTKKGIVCNIGIVFLTIPYDEVLVARTDAGKNILILYVKTEGKGDVVDEEANLQADIMPINIAPTRIDNFVAELKENNKNIIFEITAEEIQTKKKDKKEKK